MLDYYSSMQKEILKEFKKTYSFFFAANRVCDKYGICIAKDGDSIKIYYSEKLDTKNKIISKKTPEWLEKYSIGAEIIWSCVTLYRDLISENLIFDFQVKSQFATGDLGDGYSTNTSIELDNEAVPVLIRDEFEKIIRNTLFPSQELHYFYRHRLKTRNTVHHQQNMTVAWIGIAVSIGIAIAGIICR